jgi:hypothetical protein
MVLARYSNFQASLFTLRSEPTYVDSRERVVISPSEPLVILPQSLFAVCRRVQAVLSQWL